MRPDGTSSRSISELAQHRLSRRTALAGGLATAAASFFGTVARPEPAAAAEAGATTRGPGMRRLLGFPAIPPSVADQVVLPPGYQYQLLFPWGHPIVPSGPAFTKDASNSAEEQAQQAGDQHDGMWFFPLKGKRSGLLCVNHECTTEQLLHPDGRANWSPEKTAKSLAAHGVSVIEIEQDRDGQWHLVESRFARRVTMTTPAEITGPAAGHPLLRTSADPDGVRVLGTLNNCASGPTPWDTYLTCEETINKYFYFGEEPPPAGSVEDRYGIGSENPYPWHTTDARFDMRAEPNEYNRFGWVVEIDPFDPSSAPKKRTALGRMEHENAVVVRGSRGEAVVYMGDDTQFDYFYKFVGAEPINKARKHGRSPLDDGTLYVARFEEDGTGRWLPLVHGEPGLTAADGFADQAEVLIRTRLAADAVGATPMDRPEWCTVQPGTGAVFFTCTNNTARTESVNAANPRLNNRFGHIMKIDEGGDPSAEKFAWDVFLLAGDQASGATVPADQAFGSPDGLWFDAAGRLWIQTDGTQPMVNGAPQNNQMLAADPDTGDIRRFLVGPPRCEVTGITSTPDGRSLFVNIQHPGDSGTPANPRVSSNWPDFSATGRPRSATIVITREDGGVVGA
ncbi:PhoX family phosphatase [Micromonospora phytophila]|uniref:PhoX family protein n=1 Tax=Micromonospora phytophila TaxID=709888 RepID=UPI00202FC716|nr:PhoX family phosphatase [Micromonospora phytophila]MCM0674150.1 PhoX family phosphatase [Micromonospora phytophila]